MHTWKYGINLGLLETFKGTLIGGTCMSCRDNDVIVLYSTLLKYILIVWPLCWNRPCRVRLLAFAERVYKNIATCSSTETSLSSCRSCLSRKHFTKLWNTYFSIRKSLLHLNSWPSKTSLTYLCPVRMEVWTCWRLVEPLSPVYTTLMMANSSSSRCLRFKKFPHIDGAIRRTYRGQRDAKSECAERGRVIPILVQLFLPLNSDVDD